MDWAVRRTRFSLVLIATVALVGSLLSPFTSAAPAAYADPPAPSSITLAADAPTFAAGESVRLTATTDVTVSGTGQTIRIIDETTTTELKACTTGSECVVDV